MAGKTHTSWLFLLLTLCLLRLLSTEALYGKQSGAGEAVSEPAKPYVVLLVFHDPRCGACKRDEPIVDSMRGKVNMISLGWKDRDDVKQFKVRSVPAYILLTVAYTDDGYGIMEETWRTHSAAVARDRLGLAE